MTDTILNMGGRIALITGGGQGVGRQTALQLAQNNSGGVAVNDYHLDRAETVAEEIRAAGGKAFAVQADVSDHASVKEMVAKVTADFGPIGTLVNNAGNQGANPTEDVRKPFWEVDPEVWMQPIGVNFFGVLNCTSAVIPGMISSQAPARIITIISDAARNGDAGFEVYAGAKAGAAGFMRGVARAMGRYNITANCIAISATATPSVAPRIEALKKSDPEKYKKMFNGYIIRRPGMPEDIANMAQFLASDASSWITGQTYPVNGGFTLSL